MTSQDEPVSSTPAHELTPSSSKLDLRSNLSAIFLRPSSHNGPTESSPLLPGSSRGTPARTWTMDIDEARQFRQVVDEEEAGDPKQGVSLPGGEVDSREFKLCLSLSMPRWGSEEEAE